jgi:hypothetical protein
LAGFLFKKYISTEKGRYRFDALLLKVFIEVGSDYLINKLIKSGLTRNIQGCCLKQYSLPKMIQLA